MIAIGLFKADVACVEEGEVEIHDNLRTVTFITKILFSLETPKKEPNNCTFYAYNIIIYANKYKKVVRFLMVFE